MGQIYGLVSAVRRDDDLLHRVYAAVASKETASRVTDHGTGDVDAAANWREVAETAATFPLRLSCNEDGSTIARPRLISVRVFEECEEDDYLVP